MATQRQFTRHGRSRVSFGSRAPRVRAYAMKPEQLRVFTHLGIWKKKIFFSPLDMFLEHTPASPSAVVTRPGTLPDHNLTASSRTRCPARSVKFPVGKKQISKNPPSVHLLFKSHSWREPTHAYPALCTVSFARVCVYLIRHFIYIYI